MAFTNPNLATEVLYGSSGDVRDEINAFVQATTAGHYADETELPGNLIVNALRRATRLINGYLEPVYADQIPFTTIASVPKLLDEIGSDIATYYTLRSLRAKYGTIADDKRRDYFDDYVKEDDGTLSQLRDRKMQLPELTSQYTDEVKAVREQGRAPIFDVDSPENWEVDDDLRDDIERERD